VNVTDGAFSCTVRTDGSDSMVPSAARHAVSGSAQAQTTRLVGLVLLAAAAVAAAPACSSTATTPLDEFREAGIIGSSGGPGTGTGSSSTGSSGGGGDAGGGPGSSGGPGGGPGPSSEAGGD